MMPVATKYEEIDSDIVTITPPTPPAPLPDLKNSQNGNNVIEEKPEVQHLESGREAVSDERQKQIDMAAKTIRQYREKIHDGVRPYADRTREFAERQPILFTFIAILTALSIIPIATFIGFLVSATLFVVGFAAVGICLSILSCILVGSAILIPVLCFTTLVSLFLVYALVSLFLFYRLFLHVKANVSQPSGEVTLNSESIMTGIRGWLVETEKRAGFPPLPKALSPRTEKVELGQGLDEKIKVDGAKNRTEWNEKIGLADEKHDEKSISAVKMEK